MMFKDNPELILPIFQGGSYSHYDRIFLPHNQLKLKSVKIANSGDLELIAVPTDNGHEQWTDRLKFKTQDESKRKFLLDWLNTKIGETIDAIYNSEFNFDKIK